MTFICFFLCSGCEKRVNDFTIRHREKSKKSSIYSFSSSQQFYNHVFKFSNPSLFHWTSLHLSCELLSSGYFLMWKGRYSTFVFSFLFNGSSLNVMYLFLLGDHIHGNWMYIISIHDKWSSWWSNLEISHRTARARLCSVECASALSLCLHWWEWKWDDGTIVCYGNHSIPLEVHALQWKDCVKVFLFKTVALTVCAWHFVKKLEIRRNDNHTVMRELCVCNGCIVKYAF